jgi:hypothetical protein
VAWRLSPGQPAQKIWSGGPSPDVPVAVAAVAPDDKHVVAGICGPQILEPDVIAADDTVTHVPFKAACSGFTWGPDPERFIVATHGRTFAGAYSLALVAFDGTATAVWASDTIAAGWARATPGSTRVAATTRAHQFELHVLDF